jgi:hypothetical protein
MIGLLSAVVAPSKNDSPPDFTNTENLTEILKYLLLWSYPEYVHTLGKLKKCYIKELDWVARDVHVGWWW